MIGRVYILTVVFVFGILIVNKRPLTGRYYLAVLAQLAEHLTCNHEVSGSIPEDGSRAVV